MTREQRFRYVGIIFFAVFIGNLLLSEAGLKWIQDIIDNPKNSDAIVGLVGLGAFFFASEAVGFIFGSIVRFFWNIWGYPGDGGYSTQWRKKLSIHPREEIMNDFGKIFDRENQTALNSAIEQRFPEYTRDVFLSYFWHQAPKPLTQWTSRRHTAFFTGMTDILGIGVALSLTCAFIVLSGWHWTIANWILLLTAVAIMATMWCVSQYARKEAWQMIDLWLCRGFSDELDQVLGRLEKTLSIEHPDDNNE
jgi:hypothetical protein